LSILILFNSTEKIPDFDIEDHGWRIVELENDLKAIEI